MLQRITSLILDQADLRKWIVSTVILLAFLLLVMPWHEQQIDPGGETGLLDTRFGFSAQEAFDVLDALEPSGRRAYRHMLLVADTFFPLSYAFWMMLSLALLLKRISRPESPARYLVLAPLDAILFDWIENLSILRMLSQFPDISSLTAGIASVSGMIKWIVVAYCVLIMLVCAVWNLRDVMRRRFS